MSALFSLLVLAPEAYLHSPLALLIEYWWYFFLVTGYVQRFIIYFHSRLSTSSSSGILLPHPGLPETLPNPFYFLQKWNITENACMGT